MTTTSRPSSLLLVGMAMALFAGCGASTDDRATSSSEPVETAIATTPLPGPIAVVEVDEAVEFYPACGNEVLEHLDERWYPIARVGSEPMNDDLQDEVDALLAVDRAEPPGAQGLIRVSPPGPGDDLGTLVIWADGVARWTSDSGNLDVWMIDDEITYNWVC